jgi:peptidoglycan/LPS O-acetylase OafA/YrhL
VSTSSPTALRLDNVDGLRAVAALTVYVNHAYAQVASGDTVALASPYSLARITMVAGHLSVTVFIVLSGFCLALPVIAHAGTLRGGLKQFLTRRARRILPPYFAALALCLILIATIIGKPTGSLWDVPIDVRWYTIISHVLLLQDLFGTGGINYVFWSIAVEWQIYFLFPALVWGWRRFGASVVVPAALLLGYAVRVGFDGTRITRVHPQYLGMFALGMLAAHVVSSREGSFPRLKARIPWGAVAAALFCLVAALAWTWGVGRSEERFHLLDLPVGMMTMALLIKSSRTEGGVLKRILTARPLVFIGTFSYSLYLVHAPVLQILWQYVLVPLGVSREHMLVMLLTVGFLIVLGASYLVFLGAEAPILRASQRARTQATAPIAPA